MTQIFIVLTNDFDLNTIRKRDIQLNTCSLAAGAGEVVELNIGFGSEDNKATYMQDVDKTFCDKLPEVTSDDNVIEGRLIDKRDSKVYWVAKLKDNNCWMTQNLDLDLVQGEALTSDLSDVESWTPGEGETTLASDELNTTSWPSTKTNNIIRSYDPGVAVFVNGTSRKDVSLALAYGKEWLTPEEAGLPENSIATHDTNFVTTTSYTSADGRMVCTKKANDMLGDMASNYLPCRIYYYEYLNFINTYIIPEDSTHYLQGNYYSWCAASAGCKTQDGNDPAAKEDAASSICPRGWRLPSDANSISTDKGPTFKGLDLSINNILKNPNHFTRSGYINNSAKLVYTNSEGYYWSSTAVSNTAAYYLNFNSSGVNPSNNYHRYYGMSVRCVAR